MDFTKMTDDELQAKERSYLEASLYAFLRGAQALSDEALRLANLVLEERAKRRCRHEDRQS